MGRPCAACTHPDRVALDRKLRSGATLMDVVRWLQTTDRPIARGALSRHANAHLGVARTPGPRPVAGTFLERIVEAVDVDIQEGRQRPTVAHGIAAQAELNRQASRGRDADLMLKVALAISGAVSVPALPDPERDVEEARWRVLLDGGTGTEAEAAAEDVRLQLTAGES